MAARISMADAEVLLDAIALVAEPIRIWYLWRPLLRDPGDDLAGNGCEWTCRRRGHAQSSRLCAGVGTLRIRSRGAGRRCATTGESLMKKSNFALRLQPSLMEEARKVAKAEGVAVNQLINVAVAEKVSALRTEEYFAERAAKGDIEKALRVLKRSGKGNAPVPGDELPQKATRRRR